jgi:succinate dehydrogenase / fumarate reductase iron-sulfur subunit
MVKNKKEKKTIKVKVFRFDASKDKEPYYDVFKVPVKEHDPDSGTKTTVLDVLRYIKENYDDSLSFYASCLIPFWEARKLGRCSRAICNVFLNGKPVVTCEEPVTGETDLLIQPPTIDPSLGFEIIKDLIADDVRLTEKDYYFKARKKSFNTIKELIKRDSSTSTNVQEI